MTDREQAIEEAPADVAEAVVVQLRTRAEACRKANLHKDAHLHDKAAALITRLSADLAALEAENFRLAAGQCIVERGLIGDEHGHFYCSVSADLAKATDLLTKWRIWACGQQGASPFQDTRQWLSQQGDQS